MLQCWKFEPELRPSFSELVLSLSKFLEEFAGYMDFGSISTLGKPDEFTDTKFFGTNPAEPVIVINEMTLDED